MKKILLIAIAGFGFTSILSAQDISAHNGTFSGTLNVSGELTGSTGIFSGAVTAASFAGSGSSLTYSAGGITRTLVSKLIETASIKDYGAVCDGATDDAAAVRDAVAALPPGSTLIIPGQTHFGSSVTIDKALTIEGRRSSSAVNPNFPTTTIIADVGVSPFVVAQGTDHVRFAHLVILSSGKAPGSTAIRAIAPDLSPGHGIGYLHIEDVDVQGFGSGIDTRFCQLGNFKDLHLWNNTIGLYQKRCVNQTIEGGVFESNDSWGIFIDGDDPRTQSAGTRLFGVTAVHNGEPENGPSGGNLQINLNESFSIIGGMFDVPADHSAFNVLISHTSRGGISGNTWVGGSKGPGIELFDCDSVKISGCDVVNSATFGITVLRSSYCVISGNVLRGSGNADIAVLYGGQANGINDNTCTSNWAPPVFYSIVEGGPNKTSAVGNRTTGDIILDGGSKNDASNYRIPHP